MPDQPDGESKRTAMTFKPASGRTFAALLLAGMLTTDCAPGQLGNGLRPADPTAWDATSDKEGQCRVVSNFGEPLIVDWEAYQRGDLEEAMNDGVAVVAYDCHSLRLLKGCRLDSTYGFMAFSKKEENIQFENADEITANLPAFGVSLLKGLSGELTRDSTIDLAMILVGKKRTTVREAAADKLLGGRACEGATHFVRGAFVGAFAMGTGTKGAANLGLGLFKAGSKSSKLSKHRDGDPDTCQQVKSGSPSAPDACNALLRLELVGLAMQRAGMAASSGKGDAEGVQQTCSAGLVLSEGKCARPTEEKAHLCNYGDPADCTTQCEKHDAESCVSLGLMYDNARNVGKDSVRAASLFKRACDGRSVRGCTFLGIMYAEGTGVAKDEARALSLYVQACDGGDPGGCSELGVLYNLGRGVAKDDVRALSLYKQACGGGNPGGCSNLGVMYNMGTGVGKDDVRAVSLFKQGCDGYFAMGCSNLGEMYSTGSGVGKDDVRAASLFKQSCDGREMMGCHNLALAYEKGIGVPLDRAKALDLHRQDCKAGNSRGCDELKRLGETP